MDEVKKIKQMIDALDNERAQILQTLCEDEKVYLPEVLLQLVSRARSITKTIAVLNSLLR